MMVNTSKRLHEHNLQRTALLLMIMFRAKLGFAMQNLSTNEQVSVADTKNFNTNGN